MIYHYNRGSLLIDKYSTSLAFKKHDHSYCLEDAIKTVEYYCKLHELRLTSVRRKVLELLLQEHRALGAYDILDLLREAGFNSQPPVAYRALEFLVKYGFAHKIERLNAFVACTHPGEDHSPAFMICRKCDAVAEAQATASESSLSKVAQSSGFKVEETIIEARGVCPSCSDIVLT